MPTRVFASRRSALAVSAALLCAPAIARAGPSAQSSEYELTLGGARVGAARTTRGCLAPDGARRATLSVSMSGALALLYDLRFSLTTRGLAQAPPRRARTWIKERGRERSFDTWFSSKKLITKSTLAKEPRPIVRRSYAAPVHDPLSWIDALVRERAALNEGAARSFRVWDGWKFSRYRTEALGARSIVDKDSRSRPAQAVSLRREREQGAEESDAMTLYFEEGSDRALLGFDAPIGLGTLRARRVRYNVTACAPK